MILADTSIWIDHLRGRNAQLEALLLENQVACHAWIVGELACGYLHPRMDVLRTLAELPLVGSVSASVALRFLELHKLFGRGIGWIDLQLLVAARARRAKVWTLDRRLNKIAQQFGVEYK